MGQPGRDEQARAFAVDAVGRRHRQRSVDADGEAPHRSRMWLQIQARTGIERLARPQPDRRAAGLWKRPRRLCAHDDLLRQSQGGYRDDRGHRRNRRVLRGDGHLRARRPRSDHPPVRHHRSGSAAARSEVRAVYGGFGLAIAGILGYAAVAGGDLRAGILIAVGAALAGMAFGRIVSAVVDERTAFYPNWFYCLVEALAAAALFAISAR